MASSRPQVVSNESDTKISKSVFRIYLQAIKVRKNNKDKKGLK